MIIVIADDFSGAAEIAGVGHRYGLSTLLITQFDKNVAADLIVIDASTRSLTASKAAEKIKLICSFIKTFFKKGAWIFKKVDSVFRGHVLLEVKEMRTELELGSIYILPANPSKDRIIEDGKYYIKGQLLHHTSFSEDPEYPAISSELNKLLQIKPEDNYIHLNSRQNPERFGGIYTADTSQKKDIENTLRSLKREDLCAGGSDTFEVFLEKLSHEKKSLDPTKVLSRKWRIVIQGSRFEMNKEINKFKKLNWQLIQVPDLDDVGDDELNKKAMQMSQKLIQSENCFIYKPVTSSLPLDAENLTIFFAQTVKYLINNPERDQFHIYISGGSTASAIINDLEINSFKVMQELSPGVVTLKPDLESILFTIKPGSYPWTENLFL